MLVLSRRPSQRFRFPDLGITVEILEVRGSKVRVGIDAPVEVRILRDELDDHGGPPKKPSVVELPSSFRHELQNTLHEIGLMLHIYRKRLAAAGLDEREHIDTDRLFEAALARLESLGLSKTPSKPVPPINVEERQRPGSGHALVVDDNDNERELMAGFLRMCDFSVATARDGLEAIDYLKASDRPKVILLDLQMPRCDGLAFLEKLRAEQTWSSINVFVVSGDTSAAEKLTPKDGFTQWFNKPLNPCQIVQKISQFEGKNPLSV